MAYCKNCGVEIADGMELCSACAGAVATTESAAVAPGSHKMRVGRLIWSIIITYFFATASVVPIISWVGLAMGILGIVFTVRAKNAETAEIERQRLSAVKKFNIVGTILAAVMVVIAALSPILIFLAYIAIYFVICLIAVIIYIVYIVFYFLLVFFMMLISESAFILLI